MPDDLSLTDLPPFAFCVLVWLVPLLDAIKPLNNRVHLGQFSLAIATLNSMRITVVKFLIGNYG